MTPLATPKTTRPRGRAKGAPGLSHTLSKHVMDRLLAKCRRLGMTQKQMAEGIGMSHDSWDKRRAGKRLLSMEEAYRAACWLNTHYLEFFEGYRPEHLQPKELPTLDATQPDSMLS